MSYCQDGIHVKFTAETLQNTYFSSMYGYYELDPIEVNGRPYFKNGAYGIWWNGIDYWCIGQDSMKGQTLGFAFYEKDVFCPHQLAESEWWLFDGTDWYPANGDLVITCKCNFILT